MTRSPAILSLVFALAGCDQAKEVIEDVKAPEANPVEPDPEPLSLDIRNATISMITVKNGDTEVPAKFEGIEGTLTFADGAAPSDLSGSLTINVSSWDSGLELRDQRVKTTFFGVEEHASVSFRLAGVDGLPADGIEVGGESEGTATGKLSFAGATADVEARVKVSRSGDKDFHIDTVEPFVVSIDALGLTDPLKALMKECEHKSIDDSVKVSVRMDLGEAPAAEPGSDDSEKPVAATREAQIEARETQAATRAAQEGGKTTTPPAPAKPPKAGPSKGKSGKGKSGKGKSGKGKSKGKNNQKQR